MKNYTIRELRAIAKKRKIPYYTKYRKLELAQMMGIDLLAVSRRSTSELKKQREMIKSTTNWFDLSLDLKFNILYRFETLEKLWNVQEVCKDWSEICEDPSMWRVIYMDSEKCSDCRPCPPRPSHMRFDSRVPPEKITSRKMCKNAVDRSKLQLLDIAMVGFCDDELLEYVADRSPLLSRLEIAFPEFKVGNLSKALKKLPKLEELSIYSSGTLQVDEAIGSYCPELKTLKLNNCDEIGDEEIIAISKNLRELRHFEICRNLKITNTALEAILDGCPCLKVLDLRLCLEVNLQGDIRKKLEHIECVLHTEPLDINQYNGSAYLMDLKTWRKIADGNIMARMSDSDSDSDSDADA